MTLVCSSNACYSEGMTQTRNAPMIADNYPHPDYPIGRAWIACWKAIEKSTEPVDGNELAAKIAPKHDLVPATLIGVLSRAAKAGLLTRVPQKVQGSRGPRTRTFYTVAERA